MIQLEKLGLAATITLTLQVALALNGPDSAATPPRPSLPGASQIETLAQADQVRWPNWPKLLEGKFLVGKLVEAQPLGSQVQTIPAAPKTRN